MKIQQAVEKAIEGGYHPEYIPKFLGKVKVEKVEIQSCIKSPDYFIDPLFWKSLGKAMGWKWCPFRHYQHTAECVEWIVQWHRFIDHLAEGKSPESFFEQF